MKALHIDLMPGLSEHLGKHRVDRIRYHLDGTGRRQPAATNITNTVQQFLQDLPGPFQSPVEDILHGVCSADEGRIPLSVNRLFNVLQCIPIINTAEVKRMMRVDDRQAQRYVRAAKIAIPFVEKALKRSSLNQLAWD